MTRARLFEGAAAAGGTMLVGGVLIGGLPSAAVSAPSAQQDEETLRFLLGLEDLQAAFYAEASKQAGLTGERREFAQVAGDHEREHADFLRKTLGAAAGEPGAYDFRDATSDPQKFLATAIDIEEAGLGAYTGAAARLTPATLADVVRILPVEARHAAWARDLAGQNPAPRASDQPSSEAQVKATIDKTGFVKP